MSDDRCPVCGFDEVEWDGRDTTNTLRGLGRMWSWTLEGLPADQAGRRPRVGTWSVAEYTDHAADTLWAMRFAVDLARTDPGHDLGPAVEEAPAGAPRSVDLGDAIRRLVDEAAALFEVARGLSAAERAHHVVLGGRRRDADWALRHTLHDVLHHQHDVGRIRVALGSGAPPARGRLARISTSGGGVPKTAVERADIGWRGVAGDRQAARQHHGRPTQALCLWSAEVIDALRAEGHPISPGAAGENLTVEGVDWATIRPGTILQVGGRPAARCRPTPSRVARTAGGSPTGTAAGSTTTGIRAGAGSTPGCWCRAR